MSSLVLELSTSAALPDSLGNTPMHCAAASSSSPSLISQLAAAAPASAIACNEYGDTPLHAAAGFGNAKKGVLKTLICCSSQASQSGTVVGRASMQCLARTNSANQTPVQLAKSSMWSRQVAAYLQTLAEYLQAWTEPDQGKRMLGGSLYLHVSCSCACVCVPSSLPIMLCRTMLVLQCTLYTCIEMTSHLHQMHTCGCHEMLHLDCGPYSLLRPWYGSDRPCIAAVNEAGIMLI